MSNEDDDEEEEHLDEGLTMSVFVRYQIMRIV